MKTRQLLAATLIAISASSSLQANASQAFTPLWLRDVQVSPDGSQVLFCYKGDIYKVSSKGGTAVQLTTQVSYECAPVWSADGQQIAFASDRYGNLDVFVMAADGGPATRLTYQSVAEEPDSIGYPIPDNDVLIMNLKTKKEAKLGDDGEILVRGLSVMKGYLNKPKETEEAFIVVGGKKYLRTGDIGYADERGVIHFRSRLKRMIISNGYNIYPANIEDVTLKSKNVVSCAVVGREDKLRGEKVVVFAVLKPEASERAVRKELMNIYKKYLAKYEIPREIRFIPELPKTKLAKVDFKALEDY